MVAPKPWRSEDRLTLPKTPNTKGFDNRLSPLPEGGVWKCCPKGASPPSKGGPVTTCAQDTLCKGGKGSPETSNSFEPPTGIDINPSHGWERDSFCLRNDKVEHRGVRINTAKPLSKAKRFPHDRGSFVHKGALFFPSPRAGHAHLPPPKGGRKANPTSPPSTPRGGRPSVSGGHQP
ncbi:hypothetical protein RRG08_057334 [Elysia crispata]|uniref:Uncharacterized protein n=1 Tax=Elysia crispata TaxID=231223 RepID=A0AAE0YKZ4_9GAST|nr:hypothetical protein RRG08_057334 [Elysia crispata]